MKCRMAVAILFVVLAQPALLSAAELPAARDAASRSAIQLDWMRQDYAQATLAPELEQHKDDWRKTYLKSPESRHDDPVLPQMPCFVSRDDSATEQRMLAHVLEELTDSAADEIRQTQGRLDAGCRAGQRSAVEAIVLASL